MIRIDPNSPAKGRRLKTRIVIVIAIVLVGIQFIPVDRDGPPPAVGDAADWSPAEAGWPTDEGYKVVGWHDVTDDFPSAQGPWDYHHHGTALASVVAGSGERSAAATTDFKAPGLRGGGRAAVAAAAATRWSMAARAFSAAANSPVNASPKT